jgi:hypothetical protein
MCGGPAVTRDDMPEQLATGSPAGARRSWAKLLPVIGELHPRWRRSLPSTDSRRTPDTLPAMKLQARLNGHFIRFHHMGNIAGRVSVKRIPSLSSSFLQKVQIC